MSIRKDGLEALIPSRFLPENDNEDFIESDEIEEEPQEENCLEKKFGELARKYLIIETTVGKLKMLKRLHKDKEYDRLCSMMKEFSEELSLPYEEFPEDEVILLKDRESDRNDAYCIFKRGGDFYHIDQVFVDERARGRGLLSLIVCYIQRMAAEEDIGAEGISLYVQKDNDRAIERYDKLGFTVDRTYNGDDLKMIKKF